MLPIRNAIADELRAHDLLIGVEIIDHLLFKALKAPGGKTPPRSVVDDLREGRVGDAGLVVFGVHSLGLTADDLRVLLAGVELIEPDWAIALTPQTNNLGKTLETWIGRSDRTGAFEWHIDPNVAKDVRAMTVFLTWAPDSFHDVLGKWVAAGKQVAELATSAGGVAKVFAGAGR